MIDFNEITPQLTPDVLIETDWVSGLSRPPSTVKKTLLMGHKTSKGTLADSVVKRITSLSQAMEYWGEGSQLAVMAEAFMDVAPRSPLYGVSYAEGASAAVAKGTITIKGTKATTSGALKVWIAGRFFQVGIAKDDTSDKVGVALEAEIKNTVNLPFTVKNASGTLTIKARSGGPAGNTIRFRSEIKAQGLSVESSGETLASGDVAGDPTAVLARLQSQRYHLIVFNDSDSTPLKKVIDHVDKQSTPHAKKWGMTLAASTGNSTAVTSLANSLDNTRCQLVWHQKCEQPVFELAARFAALRSTKAPNISLDDMHLKGISPQSDEKAWLKESEIEAALVNGITPLRTWDNGTTEVVRSVINRHTAPLSFIDHMYVEISDYTDEYIINMFTRRVKGKPMKSGSPAGTPKTVTPAKATALLNECLFTLDRMDYLQGVEASIKKGLNFAEVNALEPLSRLDVAFAFWPIGFAHVVAIKKTFRTSL